MTYLIIDDLWLKILEAEKQGLIHVSVDIQWKVSPEQNSLFQDMCRYYFEESKTEGISFLYCINNIIYRRYRSK